MHQHIKNIDGAGQRACKQHLQLFPQMRFGEKRRKAERERSNDEQVKRDAVEKSHVLRPLISGSHKTHILGSEWVKMARLTGLEPATPGVTGRYSNQLSYNRAFLIHVQAGGWLARLTGLEPATPGVTGRYSNQLSYNRVCHPSLPERVAVLRRGAGGVKRPLSLF